MHVDLLTNDRDIDFNKDKDHATFGHVFVDIFANNVNRHVVFNRHNRVAKFERDYRYAHAYKHVGDGHINVDLCEDNIHRYVIFLYEHSSHLDDQSYVIHRHFEYDTDIDNFAYDSKHGNTYRF